MAFGADPDCCLLTQSGGAATNKRIGPPAVSGRSNFASWDLRCPACPFPNLRPPQGKALVLRRESCCPSSLASQQISCSRASNSGVEKNSPSVILKPSHSFLMVTVPGFWLSPLRILLESIPKLTMNANKLTPDNNSAGKLKQGHIVDSFLFVSNQEFTETVEKRVSNLNNPSASAKVGVAF